MSTTSTVGTSFGADALASVALTRREKTDALAHAEAQRLAALPIQVRAWRDRLGVADLECMAEVARRYRQEGMAPVRVHLPDLARRLKTDERDAEARLERLIREGAVQRTRRLAADPVFTPLTRGSVAEKADPLADLRNVVEDCRAKIEGKPLPQRAAPATSSFAPGTMLGLHRRD